MSKFLNKIYKPKKKVIFTVICFLIVLFLLFLTKCFLKYNADVVNGDVTNTASGTYQDGTGTHSVSSNTIITHFSSGNLPLDNTQTISNIATSSYQDASGAHTISSNQVNSYQPNGSNPIISAGSDQKAYPMKKIAQSATVTNPGSGIATWTWSKTSGPGTVTFDSPSSQSTNISADIAGTYAIGVTAQDSSGKSAQSSMNLTIYKMSDINNDTKIDTNDFTLLLYNWGTPKNLMTDLDGNGIVDNNDFTIMLYWWGK